MKTLRFALVALLLLVCQAAVAQRTTDDRAAAPIPKHLAIAEDLVTHLDLRNTGYNHGDVEVKFSSPCESHTDCSGFADALLEYSYDLDKDQLRKIFGSDRPTAKRYHDAIVNQNGFHQIERIQDVQPGDFLAVKYLKRTDNTGHVMLVAATPQRIRSKSPELPDTQQWQVAVIDSSKSGHGPTDTRHKKGENGKDHDGVGEGVFRIYTDGEGKIAGFTWSTVGNSEFREPSDEHLVIGRMDLEAIKSAQ